MNKNAKNFTREHLLYLKKARTRNILVHVTQVGILVLLLAIWELAAHLGWIDAFIMSGGIDIGNPCGICYRHDDGLRCRGDTVVEQLS